MVIVTKCRNNLESYLSIEDQKRNAEASCLGPSHLLKGAAKQAQQFYLPPNYREPIHPENLIAKFSGKMWEHEKCRELLFSMLKLGVTLQNSNNNRTNEAIATFREIMQLDEFDHLLARHKLLRCYLDRGNALQARQLLDQFPSDRSSCFSFSRALIEYISLSLKEKGAAKEIVDRELANAISCNAFTAWTIAYHETFAEAVDHLELLPPDYLLQQGSIEEALLYFHVDLPLWKDTEGAVDFVRSYLRCNNVEPPNISAKRARLDEDTEKEDSKHHEMFAGMFSTAMEMIEEEREVIDANDAELKKGGKKHLKR